MTPPNQNSEDELVQKTFANHLRDSLGWESITAWPNETFGPDGTLGRADISEVVLTRDLRAAVARLNPQLPKHAHDLAVTELTRYEHSRSMLQHNQLFYRQIRDGVLVIFRDAEGVPRTKHVQVIDFTNIANNRFLAVRELKIRGLRAPFYNRRADLVCFVNGLPWVFIELKAIHRNIRAGFDENLTDYMSERGVPHAFYHNAFLVVSNGHRAKYGSITSGWDHFAEWKRHDEKQAGSLDGQVLLDGMLAKERLLDIVSNFILFDGSKPGSVRKVVARNQQILGVNLALASVQRQEQIKREIPIEKRFEYKLVDFQLPHSKDEHSEQALARQEFQPPVKLVERAHKELGQLGVFWHTQGSGKSYSMVFFSEKVRRTLSGNFTFVLMTDRIDLDSQIHKTFIGCGAADEQTPRAASGNDLRRLLGENHKYIFSVIHKFNQEVDPSEPYSRRDDIVVISDEAHRTQGGKLARNMRLALPNAAFIGFTGTPLFKHDHLTKRLFGNYVSRYDFRRSEQDGSTVKLVYDNRGEKLGIAKLDLNDRIAEKIEEAELDDLQRAHLEKLLGKDYEVITADERLDKIAADFVQHCAARWEQGKAMLVCIDKITCARLYMRIIPRWQAETASWRQGRRRKPMAKSASSWKRKQRGWLKQLLKSSSVKRKMSWRNSRNGISTSYRTASG